MKNPSLERLIYFLVVFLSAIVLGMIAYSHFFLLDTKVVYQGF